MITFTTIIIVVSNHCHYELCSVEDLNNTKFSVRFMRSFSLVFLFYLFFIGYLSAAGESEEQWPLWKFSRSSWSFWRPRPHSWNSLGERHDWCDVCLYFKSNALTIAITLPFWT